MSIQAESYINKTRALAVLERLLTYALNNLNGEQRVRVIGDTRALIRLVSDVKIGE